MFDISWGEIAVLTSAGLILIGRKDLPIASHAIGQQIGRIVGLLQGARIRADRYANDHQLKQLQNEFKSGLRELDAVKAELAGSMLSSSQVGGGAGNLGALMVSSVDKKRKKKSTKSMNGGEMIGGSNILASSPGLQSLNSNVDNNMRPPTMPQSNNMNMGAEYLAAAQQAESAQDNNSQHQQHTSAYLAPRSQSVAAVAEEEWEKRGIGFKSIAESGGGQIDTHDVHSSAIGGSNNGCGEGGATILSNYIRQSLIYDQYERTVREQDEALRSRVDKVRNERIMNKNNDKGE